MIRTLLLCLLLTGCTAIDYSRKVEGWPVMREELHVVSAAEMHNVCDKYAGFGEVMLSCAEMFFHPDVCKIWVTEAGGWLEEHERAHCRGHDHIGGDSMRKMLAKRK